MQPYGTACAGSTPCNSTTAGQPQLYVPVVRICCNVVKRKYVIVSLKTTAPVEDGIGGAAHRPTVLHDAPCNALPSAATTLASEGDATQGTASYTGMSCWPSERRRIHVHRQGVRQRSCPQGVRDSGSLYGCTAMFHAVPEQVALVEQHETSSAPARPFSKH